MKVVLPTHRYTPNSCEISVEKSIIEMASMFVLQSDLNKYRTPPITAFSLSKNNKPLVMAVFIIVPTTAYSKIVPTLFKNAFLGISRQHRGRLGTGDKEKRELKQNRIEEILPGNRYILTLRKTLKISLNTNPIIYTHVQKFGNPLLFAVEGSRSILDIWDRFQTISHASKLLENFFDPYLSLLEIRGVNF